MMGEATIAVAADSSSGSDEDKSGCEIEEERSLSPATAVEKSDGLKIFPFLVSLKIARAGPFLVRLLSCFLCSSCRVVRSFGLCFIQLQCQL